MIGRRVWHLKGGWCVIRRLFYVSTKLCAIVDFEKGAKYCDVSTDELRDSPGGMELAMDESEVNLPFNFAPSQISPEGSTATPVPRVAAPVSAIPLPAILNSVPSVPSTNDPPWLNARRSIFALRLGQISDSLSRHLTVGTSGIEQQFARNFFETTRRKPRFLVVEGPWGTGKSHALSLAKAIAFEHRLAVSTVVLDGVMATLGRPIDLLRSILTEAYIPTPTGKVLFSEEFESFIRDNRRDIFSANGAGLVGDAIAQIPTKLANDPDAWDIVESYLTGGLSATQAKQNLRPFTERLLPLISLNPRAVLERPGRAAQLLGEWGCATRCLGASGLVVMLDEADVDLDIGGRSKRERNQRDEYLTELGRLSEGSIPLCVIIAVAPSAPDDDEETPTSRLLKRLGDGAELIKVPPIESEMLIELTSKIVDLYQNAYPEGPTLSRSLWSEFAERMTMSMEDSVDGLIPRLFIRTFLEYLDILSLGNHETVRS